MLGTRTKQVISYGRRNQRVVVADDRDRKPPTNIFDDLPPPQWAPVASRMKKRENALPAKPRSPTFVVMKRKKRLSPVMSPQNVKKRARAAQLVLEERAGVDSKSSMDHPLPRLPLSPCPINILNSPIATKKKKPALPSALGRKNALKEPVAPDVDIDIATLDKDGRTISKERRLSKDDIPSSTSRKAKSSPPVIALASTDSEADSPVIRPPKSRRAKVICIVSDDEEDDLEPPLSPAECPAPLNSLSSSPCSRLDSHQRDPHIPRLSNHLDQVPRSRQPCVSTSHRNAPSSPTFYGLPTSNPSPLAKPRPLTPIRNQRGLRFYNPPSPPSPSGLSDFDLSAEFESLNIADGTDSSISVELLRPQYPHYLLPLLTECGQEDSGPYEFSAFIGAFPLDPVVRKTTIDVHFKKIGEASYSEVFGIGDVVLKIIPLRDEQLPPGSGSEELDGPPPSDAKDVLKEIIVTRAMGNVSDGFVELLKTYVVRGRYPELLLDLWDKYSEQNGSESVRPDTFLVSQVYTIIVLPNGGPDLEAYAFNTPTKTGWRQASSIFWQVAKTLAHAEQLVSFEHRDLHWGQILVKNTLTPSYSKPLASRNLNQNSKAKSSGRMPMDDQRHGVKVTLIDLGLSRMDAGDGHGGEIVHWTPFDEEIFMGEGDYQFDIYRLMRDHNGDSWEEFRPLTNVMWLHYLLMKLLKAKKLRAPATRKDKWPSVSSGAFSPATPPTEYTERECYEVLVELEKYLSKSITSVVSSRKAKGKGRRKTVAPQVVLPDLPGPSCAGELIEYGVKHGWVHPIR